jgi:CubicO group peptidase (beta-lactamase class C family)
MTAVEGTISGVCEPGFGAVADAFAANLTDRGDLGARVCVMLDGKVVVDQWGGWADRARTRPWTDDTLTNMWSSTKGVVALAAQMLVDRASSTRRRSRPTGRVRGRRRSRCPSATC